MDNKGVGIRLIIFLENFTRTCFVTFLFSLYLLGNQFRQDYDYWNKKNCETKLLFMLFNFYGRPDRSCGADSFERRIVPLRRQQTHPSVFFKTTQNWFTPTSAFFFFSFFLTSGLFCFSMPSSSIVVHLSWLALVVVRILISWRIF